MSAVATATISLGLLVVCTRGPLAVAPAAALRSFRRLIATNDRTRIFGAFLVMLGAAMIWAGTTEDSTLASLLTLAGLVTSPIGTLVAIFSGWYRELAGAILPALDDESLPGWRLIGILGTSAGLVVIYVGVLAL